MRIVRGMLVAVVTGALLVGSVWAGAGLSPVGVEDVADRAASAPLDSGDAKPAPIVVADGVTLGADELLVGASKVDLKPRPDASKGEVWVTNESACETNSNPGEALAHAADPRVTWLENTNCIYMGGFGIGPSQAVVEWDDYDPSKPVVENGDVNLRGYGLWVRSAAFLRPDAEGTMKAIVVTIVDGEGYFGAYNRMCPPELACGIHDIQTQMGTELGLDPASFVVASTHAHSAMDFIGGWGGVPTWYMRQAAEAIRESIREAVRTAEPARLEGGEAIARGNNRERRNFYRSAEDPTANWLRAVASDDGQTITTVGTFAAHATSFGSSAKLAHTDWPGVFAKRVEERFGGIGLMFEAGLGNMSSSGGYRMGRTVAELIPPVGSGKPVGNPVVRAKQEFWEQPATNVPLSSIGAAGFFDRKFSGPAAVTAGKNATKPCRSASPASVRVSVVAAKIGDVVITSAPGEIFANYSNTIEERSPITALAIGQANDALGYMPQSFETDHVGRQGTGFSGSPRVAEYEDAYSIDACFGDKALETTLSLLDSL